MAESAELSAYTKDLLTRYPDVAERYLMKIKAVSMDPFCIVEENLSRNFPEISPHDIISYLIFTHSYYTHEQYKAFKSLDAYKYFEAGFVNLMGTQIINDQIILLGKVKHSQRMREKPLSVWILCKLEGDIKTAHCTCMAGLGEVCSHIGAVLYATEYIKRHETKLSVTDQECTWSAPSARVMGNIPVVPIKQMNWGNVKTSNVHASSSSCSTDVQPDLQQLLQNINDEGLSCAALRVFEPFATELRTDQTLQLVSCLEIYDQSYDELLKIASTITLRVSANNCMTIEVATMQQAHSYEWYRHRAGRITASNFKRTTRTKIENPSISLIKTICYPVMAAFKSKATSWGIKHEKCALRQFTELIKDSKKNLSVQHTGLVVDSNFPQLGAFPDAILYSDDGKKVVEIKCPYLLKQMSLVEFSKKGGTCLKYKEGGVELDRDHSYYYQVQMQLKLTQATRGYFVVWSPCEIHIEEVMLDEQFWSTQVKKALDFHSKIIMPELLGRFFTNQHSCSINEEWCFCKQAHKNNYMIKCNNEECKIVWFQRECEHSPMNACFLNR